MYLVVGHAATDNQSLYTGGVLIDSRSILVDNEPLYQPTCWLIGMYIYMSANIYQPMYCSIGQYLVDTQRICRLIHVLARKTKKLNSCKKNWWLVPSVFNCDSINTLPVLQSRFSTSNMIPGFLNDF